MVSTETSQPAWDDALLRDPHAVADKRSRVRRMFAAIAPSYDLNNRLHSLWMDQRWRRTAVKLATLDPNDRVVDVACGTGDLTLAFARRLVKLRRKPLDYRQLLGIDFTFEMLPIAIDKSDTPYFPGDAIYDSPNRYSRSIRFLNGDAQSLPL